MKRGTIILAIILTMAVFATACDRFSAQAQLKDYPLAEEPTEPAAVEIEICNPPYFEFKKNACCLDTNSNKICDSEEKKPEIPNYGQSTNSDIIKVVNSLQAQNIDVIDLAPGFDSINGDILVLWLNAPGSEANKEQVKIAFTEMYSLWKNKYNSYFIHVDNAKNRNPYRKQEVCTFGASYTDLRDATKYNRWDDIFLRHRCWA
jgi:hypothetical protein